GRLAVGLEAGGMEQYLVVHDGTPGRRARRCLTRERRERDRESTIAFSEWPRPPRSAAADFGLEPGPGIGPVAVGGGRGDAQHLGGLLAGQAGKVAQLDELRLLGIDRGQLLEGLVEGEQLVVRLGCGDGLEGLSSQVAAALLGTLPAGVVDQDTAHGGGRRREEMA